jgi:hypothetical protein
MNRPSVFISYGREDAAEARRLYADLAGAGMRPWMDPINLLPGQRWKAAIGEAIESSRFFVALLSSRSVDRRGYVHREIIDALEVLDTYPEHDIYLIPARLDDCRPSHRKLQDLNWVDLFPEWSAGMNRIVAAITGAAPNCYPGTMLGALVIDDIITSQQTTHLLLDIRVRNSGSTTVNITRADLHVISRVTYAGVYQPSASYDLLLSDEHNVISVAHVLRPEEVDRFTIRVGFTPFNTSCGFKAELVLKYNGDLQTVSEPFSFDSTFPSDPSQRW